MTQTSFSFLSLMDTSLDLLAAFCLRSFTSCNHFSSSFLNLASSFNHSASTSFNFFSSSCCCWHAAICNCRTWKAGLSPDDQEIRLDRYAYHILVYSILLQLAQIYYSEKILSIRYILDIFLKIWEILAYILL